MKEFRHLEMVSRSSTQQPQSCSETQTAPDLDHVNYDSFHLCQTKQRNIPELYYVLFSSLVTGA